MENTNDILTGLRVPSQIPLDAKGNCPNEATLKNLGTANQLAFIYEQGLRVYCVEEETRWEWREMRDNDAPGLMTSNFTYPSGAICNSIDYSGRTFNFFPTMDSLSMLGSPYQILVNSLDVKLSQKKGAITDYDRLKNRRPSLANEDISQRWGYIAGKAVPTLTGNNVTYDEETTIWVRANVCNLGIRIENFEAIKEFNPILHISKYTHSKRKESKGAQDVPFDQIPLTVYTTGKYKINAENDPCRVSQIPLVHKQHFIDFGQEHYFKTSNQIQINQNFYTPDTDGNGILILARGLGARTAKSGFAGGPFTAFCYLQLHISIEVAGKVYFSKPLARFKMVARIKVDEAFVASPGDVLHVTPVGEEGIKLADIRYKFL